MGCNRWLATAQPCDFASRYINELGAPAWSGATRGLNTRADFVGTWWIKVYTIGPSVA